MLEVKDKLSIGVNKLFIYKWIILNKNIILVAVSVGNESSL